MSEQKLWNSNYIKIWMSNFFIHFAFTLIVPLLPLYLNERFGAGKDVIGIVLAGYSIMTLMVRPFSGFLVDSFPRKAVLLICNFIFVALFGGYLMAGSLVVFAIFRTLHGLPFGSATVAISTVAIDVLPSERRVEGIGFFGLSNNLATAIGPVIAVIVLNAFNGNFSALFWLSIVVSSIGLVMDATVKLPKKDYVPNKKVISLDRFFLLKGWREALTMVCFAASYGVVSTYVAIYGKNELGMQEGTGMFFTLLAVGLMLSRLTGVRALRKNKVTRNATLGMLVSVWGYLMFAALHNPVGYYGCALVVGLGNGHMYPAFQNMFINLAEHNQRGTANSSLLIAWDSGVGLGVLAGGLLAESLGYYAAFWTAFGFNVLGVIYYLLRTRRHFESCKLR